MLNINSALPNPLPLTNTTCSLKMTNDFASFKATPCCRRCSSTLPLLQPPLQTTSNLAGCSLQLHVVAARRLNTGSHHGMPRHPGESITHARTTAYGNTTAAGPRCRWTRSEGGQETKKRSSVHVLLTLLLFSWPKRVTRAAASSEASARLLPWYYPTIHLTGPSL